MSDNKWTPALSSDGKLYCSPACGCNCTKAAHGLALSRAEALAKEMGEGWEPHVWENCGWHYQVRNKCMKVMPHHYWGSEKTTYTAWIEPGLVVCDTHFQIIETAENPHDALGIAKQKAWESISRIRAAITELEIDLSASTPS